MQFECSVLIKDDPEIVFAFITNPRIRKYWNKTLNNSTFEYDNLMLGNSASLFFEETIVKNSHTKKYMAELLKFEPAENFRYRYLAKNYIMSFDYLLKKTNNGTEVKLNTSIAYQSALSELITSIRLLGYKKQIVNHLAQLKQFCECN